MSTNRLIIRNCAESELEGIQERYVQVLRSFLLHSAPHNPGRLAELLAHIPEVRLHDKNTHTRLQQRRHTDSQAARTAGAHTRTRNTLTLAVDDARDCEACAHGALL